MPQLPKSRKRRWLYGLGALLVIGMIANIVDPPKDPAPAKASKPATSTPSTTPAKPKPKPKPAPKLTPGQRLTAAVRADDDLKLREFDPGDKKAGEAATITLETPSGDPDTDDTDDAAAAAYLAAHKAGWKRSLYVVFRGGAQSKATGKDLPDFLMATYRMTASEAAAITDWSDGNIKYGGIDWSYYRLFASPLLSE